MEHIEPVSDRDRLVAPDVSSMERFERREPQDRSGARL